MTHLTNKDLRSDDELSQLGFGKTDIEHYKALTVSYFEMLVNYDRAVAAKDFRTQIDVEEVKPKLEAEISAFGVNPKHVPVADLCTLAHYSDDAAFGDDAIVAKYKSKINSPASGIRAFCVNCQGGSMAAVMECASSNCPLYFFRLGSNPLFGKALPPVNFLEIEGDDVPDIDESADAGDAE